MNSIHELLKDINSSIINDMSTSIIEFSNKHKEVSVEVMRQALIGNNLTGIPKDLENEFLSEIVCEKENTFICYVLSNINLISKRYKFSHAENVIFAGFIPISMQINTLYIEWRKKVDEFYSSIKSYSNDPENDINDMLSFRKKNNLITDEYVFSIPEYKKGVFVERTWNELFPSITKDIVKMLSQILSQLEKNNYESNFIEYIRFSILFFKSTDPIKSIEYAKSMDKYWVQTESRLLPIHGMETYEDINRFMVSPELKFCIVDEDNEDIKNRIEETRKILFKSFNKKLKNNEKYKLSIPLMEKSKANVYLVLYKSGSSMTLNPFGQNCPNFREVRIETGIRVMIFFDTAFERWHGEEKSLLELFDNDNISLNYKNIVDDGSLFKTAAIVAVGGHEISHNLLVAHDVSGMISPTIYSSLEENKANLAILTSLRGSYSIDDIRTVILYEIGYSLKKLHQIGETSVLPYVNYAILAFNGFLSFGIVKNINGKYFIDVGKEDNINEFLDYLDESFMEIVDVYSNGTIKTATEYINKYFTPNEQLKKLISLIDR